jgi:hypothetical protein
MKCIQFQKRRHFGQKSFFARKGGKIALTVLPFQAPP